MTQVTRLSVLGVVAALIIYDIVAYAVGGVGSTISRVILSWAQDIPIIVLIPGVLCGHFFWPQPCQKCKRLQ